MPPGDDEEARASTGLRGNNLRLLDAMLAITGEYSAKGYRYTVRQLFYQLVARGALPNDMASYKRTSKVATAAREAGLIEWDDIVDRGRRPLIPREYASIYEYVSASAGGFRRYRWEGQEEYVELLVEKDALTEVLAPVASKYHVTMTANRGYASASAMHELADRISLQTGFGFRPCVLYMGDHDPSGMDMVRDVRDRLRRFGAFAPVERVALNMDQIREHGLPPNPAKASDPRAGSYVSEYGGGSWELDALGPEALAGLAEDAITAHMDIREYRRQLRLEAADRKRFVELARGLPRYAQVRGLTAKCWKEAAREALKDLNGRGGS